MLCRLRYIRLAGEPCLAAVSRNAKILYAFSSDDAEQRGFKWLGNKDVPDNSQAELVRPKIHHFERAFAYGRLASERRAGAKLWGESVMLGGSGYVLTFLTWADYKPD